MAKKPNRPSQPGSPSPLGGPTPAGIWEKSHETLIGVLETHLGETLHVFREMIPTGPRIDVHLVGPTEELPFHKLFTVGMSQTKMPAPKDFEDCQRAELLIGLPDDWPITPEAFMEDAYRWPVLLLRHIARIPASAPEGKWLFAGHAVPITDASLFPGLKFTGGLLLPPLILPEEAHVAFNDDFDPIHLLGIIPLYPEELALAQTDDLPDLLEALDELEATEILDLHRPNACQASE